MKDPSKERRYELRRLLRLDADRPARFQILLDQFELNRSRFGTIWLRMAWELWGEGWY